MTLGTLGKFAKPQFTHPQSGHLHLSHRDYWEDARMNMSESMPSIQRVVRPGENCRSSQPPFSGLLGESTGVCSSHFNVHTHVTPVFSFVKECPLPWWVLVMVCTEEWSP